MKKVLSAFLAVATIAGSLAATMPTAEAQHRHRHHHHHGHGGGAAIGLGLLGGAIAGAAIANSGGYYGPGYGYYGGGCYLQRERFWDGYGWRVRRVQVCN
ncbi:hypothetical protein YH63_012395 [Afipia massiliensis]|uniref:Sulfur globule protein n=1 Tax=Afipia massiliensis TaxID=211460 RepID=A0A4V6BE35_9BRAD|nr:hypothetical protein [Afipia massiliensis]TKT72153.1 hypothetical protein YH63_012395 [Afipia massiliensis]